MLKKRRREPGRDVYDDPTVYYLRYENERTQRLLYGLISQERCTAGSARSGGETHLFGRKDRSFENKMTLTWPIHKHAIEKREERHQKEAKGGEGKLSTQMTLKSIYCRVIPGSITADCLTSRRTEIIVIGLMYVLSTRTNILLRDCSQFALTRPLKR